MAYKKKPHISKNNKIGRRGVLRAGGNSALLAMLTPLGGCGRGDNASVGAQDPRICIDGFLQEAQNFNPLLASGEGPEAAVEYTVFDTLWRIDPQGNYIPNLAREIPSVENGGVSSDGLVWRIGIRPDISWHDGAPFTTRDLLFTLEALRDPSIPVRNRKGQTNIESIRQLDAYTIELRLKRPFAANMAALQRTSIVPSHILSGAEDLLRHSFNLAPVGTGPFRFSKRAAGDHIEFTANEKYHGRAPEIHTLIQKYVPDQQTLFAQLQAGVVTILDGRGIPADQLDRAKNMDSFEVVMAPAPYVEFIYFNLARPQFSEKAVRQAIHHAVDRSTWIDGLYYGLPEPTLSFLPARHWAYNHGLKAPAFNLDKAAQLLAAAGWRRGADGVREKNGVRLSFSCSTASGDKARMQAQLLLQQNLKQIGIDMRIRNMPGAVIFGEFTTMSQFDMLFVGWEPTFFPDPDYTDRIASDMIPAQTGAGANYSQYSNPEIDRLCALGLESYDRGERYRAYARIQEILLEDLPFIPIFSYRSALGVSRRLAGFRPNPYTPCNSWNNSEWALND